MVFPDFIVASHPRKANVEFARSSHAPRIGRYLRRHPVGSMRGFAVPSGCAMARERLEDFFYSCL